MPILPDPSGVAGVSVSAATAFTGAAERRRNRSATEQDATVHNIKCGKLSVQVLADGADPRVAEHRRHTHTVSPLADTRGFERCETRNETERPAGTRLAASAVEASRVSRFENLDSCGQRPGGFRPVAADQQSESRTRVIAQRLVQEAVRRAHAHHRDS